MNVDDIVLEWIITNLVRHSENDMIFSIEWKLNATLGLYATSAEGTIGLKASECPIPFIDLTRELVIEWLLAALGEEQQNAIEQGLIDTMYNNYLTPSTYDGMPW
jgi:hypothetical protein